ncbi:MAG: DUF4397 domain-containing protein [Haliscomenobacteraceae bacterium CHB4]|nr:DUF4397 domain-containing protein [Haliscomenobacteraceae bacterium CHB4]
MAPVEMPVLGTPPLLFNFRLLKLKHTPPPSVNSPNYKPKLFYKPISTYSMKHLITTLFALLLSAIAAQAQFARLQVIHNAPDPTVDVYVNGILTYDNFAFRTARSFTSLPAGIPLAVAVAPGNSSSAAQAFFTANLTLENGKTYAVTASGIEGNPATPFTLSVDENAREGAADPAKVAVNVLHGAPDAPAVDVVVRAGDKIVSNLAYGQFTPYLELDPGLYYLDVKPAGQTAIVGTYKADLSALAGGAVRVFASGLLNGTPGFGLWAALPGGQVLELPLSPVARVQVIHNSPDQAVDVYANGDLLLDDFAYRTASPFVYMPVGLSNIGVALDNSLEVGDTLANFPLTLVNGGTYVAVAEGIPGDPNTPLRLVINANAREQAGDTAKTDLTFYHGSPDAPDVDIDVIFEKNAFAGDLAYGSFANEYLSVLPGKNDLKLRLAGTQNEVETFRVDLTPVKGKAATIFASGFVSSAPDFALFAVYPDGTVAELTLTPFTRWQVVHNAPNPTVDVYAGQVRLLDNFAFRTATPFLDVPADRTFSVGVAPDNSNSAADAIATFPVSFDTGKTYAVFASGIVGNGATPFTLVVDPNAQESGTAGFVSAAVLHGSPGAPAVDVDAVFIADNLIENLAYGEFTPYQNLAPQKYDLAIRVNGSPDVVASFRADLSGLDGKSAYVFASGILNGSPAFGLFAVLDDGTVLEFTATPTARVQIIHNSPDPTVDVYAGNTKLLEDFAFRTATPFIDVPADIDFNVGVAPANSTSPANAIFNTTVNFETGKTYAVFANGIVFNGGTPFTLLADEAREAALDPAKIEFATLHGSPGAPAVDVALYNGPTLISDLAYGEFAPYLGVDPGVYLLQVKVAGTSDVVGTFRADLNGLDGRAARVFASGIVNGTPAFGLFAAFPDGTVIEFLPASANGRIQIIHNSPSATVDIYADNILLADDLEFRNATAFLDVPGDVPVNIGIAPANSTSAADAFASFPAMFEVGKIYVVTAAGILNDPTTPLNLFVNESGREAAQLPFGVDIAIFHGATNAPAVDVDAVFDASNVVQNLAYGQYSPYLGLGANKYDFAIRGSGAPDVLVSYRADLSSLSGQAATVFASGLIGGIPEFGLFAALADGTVLPLPVTPTARVQVIHNAPDPNVDVYAGSTLLLDDFAFRTATAYVTLPADRTYTIGVAGNGSTSSADVQFPFPVSFETGKTYAVFASGIPSDMDTPFTLFADEAREAALDPTKVEFAALHGSPGAPAVDIVVVGGGSIATNLAYGAFTPYLALDPGVYTLQVKASGTNTTVGYYQADLGVLAGNSARVFASGILNGAPGFGLFAALADGTVVEFTEVGAPPQARLQIIHNSPSPTVDVYVNGGLLLDDFSFRQATPFLDVQADVPLSIAIAPGNSTSVADALAAFPVQFEDGKTYIATASGILLDPVNPFTLILNAEARETASNSGQVDVAVLHGSPGAPAVDVDAVFAANNVVQNLAYGEFTPYLNLNAEKYDLAVRASGSPNVVASYRADLIALAGNAAYVFASGILGGTPAFGLFAALPNGTVLELQQTPTSRVQIVHNSPDPTVDVYAGNTLLLDDFKFRTATPFVDVPADRDIAVGIALPNSTSAADAFATFPVSFETGKRYTVMAAGVVGSTDKPFNLFADANARETAAPGFTSISVFQGLFTPLVQSLDVNERLIGTLFDNVDFGAFTPYQDLANGDYYLDVTLANFTDLFGTHYLDPALFSNKPARIFTSGILGNDTLNYGLFAVFPDGTVVELPNTPVARVQIIHNSPEPTVDIYAGADKILDDFDFREATPFFYANAEVQIPIGIAPGSSQSSADVLATFPVTLENRKTYIVVASGILGGSPGFDLIVHDMGRERALDDTKLELAIHHGAPGAPNVDVTLPLTGGATAVGDLAYGEFTDYLGLDPDVYLFDVSAAADPNILAGTWGGDFSTLGGVVGVVFASGILGGDPEFDLWLALPNGFTLPLPAFARAQVIHNSPSPTVDVYLDTTRVLDNFQFHQATGIGFLPARVPFTLNVAPGNSTSSGDAIYNLPVELETGKTYIIMAAGVLGGNPGFGLFVNENGRSRAFNSANVEAALFHGSPDAPEVDVQLPGGPVLFDNVDFGEYADYISVPPSNYTIQITPSNDNTAIVKTYKADLSNLDGQAITVFASGFLTGGQPEFQVWVAETDGDTYPLEELVRTNELDGKLNDLQLAPNPTVADLFVRFDLTEAENLRYGIRDLTGRLVLEGDFGTVNAGQFAQKLDVGSLPSGMYSLEIVSDGGVRAMKFVVQE